MATTWWSNVRELMGERGVADLKRLLDTLYVVVNSHFDDKEASEAVIRSVFKRCGDRMKYGRDVHEMIHKTRNKEPKLPERIDVAVNTALDLIRDPEPGGSVDDDVRAVMPIVAFYHGFVVDFGRGAGFNNHSPESEITAIKSRFVKR